MLAAALAKSLAVVIIEASLVRKGQTATARAARRGE
jgi:hypothetical protein